MATVSEKTDKPVRLIKPGAKKDSAAAPIAPRKGGFRPLRWLLRVTLLAVILVAAAPYLIAYTPLKTWIAKRVLQLHGDIEVGSLSLSWISPVTVKDLKIKDEQGRPLLKLSSFTSETPLYKLALSPTRPGKFVLDGVELEIYLRDDGSNVEDVFASWLNKPANPTPPASSAAALPTVGVELKNGRVTIHDQSAKQDWTFEQIHAEVSLDAAQPHPIVVTAEGAIPQPTVPGKLSLELQGADLMNGAAVPATTPATANQIALNASNVPLPMFQALLRRFLPGAKIDGQFQAKLQGAWTGSGQNLNLTLAGEADVNQLALAAPTLFTNRDQLALRQIQIPIQVAITGDQLQVNTLGITCDCGELAVQGTVPLRDASNDLFQALCQQSFALQGRVDLARLAALLPETLRVRAGTQITGGQLALTVANKPAAGGAQLTGDAQIQNLAATSNGKAVAESQPIRLHCVAHNLAASPAIDEFELDSSFAVAKAAGGADALTADVECDLGQLTTELEKFVDLGQLHFGGRGKANVAFQKTPAGKMAGTVQADFQAFQFATTTLNLAADSGAFTLAGQASDVGFDVSKLQATIQQLRSAGSLALDEKAIQLAAVASWDSSARRLQLANLVLQSDTLAVAAQHLTIALPNGGVPLATGTIAYQGDVNRLQRLLGDPQANWQFVGTLKGQAQFTQDEALLSAKLDATVENIALWNYAAATSSDPALRKPAWQEARVVLSGSAALDRAADAVRLDSLTAQAETLRLRLAGSIAHLSSEQAVDLKGSLDCDLSRVTPLLWPYVGQGIQLAGNESYQLAFRGQLGTPTGVVAPAAASPLWQTCEAQANFGWQSANLYGLPAGEAKLGVALAKGQPRIDPISVQVGGGRLTLTPQIKLGDAAEIDLPSGPILQQIHITPEICSAGLKYFAPMVMQSAKCDGTLSLDTTGARIPLSDPMALDMGGHFTIHSLQLSSGPLASDFIGLMSELEAAVLRKQPANPNGAVLTMKEQQVEYRVVNRRIYHRQIEMQTGDITIRSSGSVGFDESLDLVLEIPILDRWLLPGDPLQLRGKSIQIPVKGSFAKRDYDRTGFTKLAGDAIKGLGGQLLNNEINKGLNKLFPQK
ncbi:MAG TPA: DUF748 domain-containing protein [Pirellulales bacterium]|jgi:hypothetical protein|nr:DUF748 domain-containing protein [Pirellulales bacterium]